MYSKLTLYPFIGILLLMGACSSRHNVTFTEDDLSIVPMPDQLTLQTGNFIFNEQTLLVTSELLEPQIWEVLSKPFQVAAGWELQLAAQVPEDNYVLLQEEPSIAEEGYVLTADADHVVIKASDRNGFLYGLETVLQLLPPAITSNQYTEDVDWLIPAVNISDAPEYSWRGLMLDVSRHFFPKDYVLDVIDQLAFHKLNKLHLHLIDDQGWRIEVKQYPRLTEVGAYRVDQEDAAWNARRTPELGEEATYGGYYTQEEIKEIVAYATSRGIDVIPEIEMPAHVMSAVASYPELSCKGTPIMVPSGGVWPNIEIYCAGKESTFEFLENVLEEVIPLFPYEYVHVGGDEATKTNWESCPHCQRRIHEEGLASVEELQSYFMKRMERYLMSKGKRMIGWDEILEGGLAPEATVMSWRGFAGGWEASKAGHDVVMTPTGYCYFDYYQGPQDVEPEAFNAYTPLSKVYEFSPVVDSMSEDQKQHILGGQANLWSEFIPTTDHSEYMIYPRIAALSEALWTRPELHSWERFSQRLKTQLQRYDHAGLNYAKSAYAVVGSDSVDILNKQIALELETEMPDTDIRYALSGEVLNDQSKRYTEPIVLTASTQITAAAFQGGKPFGATFTKEYHFHKAFGKPVTYQTERHASYTAKAHTLVDGVNGSLDFHDKKWQGWLNKPMEMRIDLEEVTLVQQVKVSSLESQGSGIYFPSGVIVSVSQDGKQFTEVGKATHPAAKNPGRSIKVFEVSFEETSARYLRVVVANPGPFIFLDEVQVY